MNRKNLIFGFFKKNDNAKKNSKNKTNCKNKNLIVNIGPDHLVIMG